MSDGAPKATTLQEYASQEAGCVLNGDKLVAPEQLEERWGVSRAELRRMWRGEVSGVYLPPLRFGQRTIRFRLADVLRVEWELYGRR